VIICLLSYENYAVTLAIRNGLIDYIFQNWSTLDTTSKPDKGTDSLPPNFCVFCGFMLHSKADIIPQPGHRLP